MILLQLQTGDGQSSRHELTGRLPLVWWWWGGKGEDLRCLQYPSGDARIFKMCVASYLCTNAQKHTQFYASTHLQMCNHP